MARAILVRHGRTSANTAGILAGRGDTEIDEHGRTQALQLAEDLAAIDLHAAVASPMLRTRQTLDLLLPPPADTPVHYDESVAEVDYGLWTGKSLKELADHPLWATVQRHPASVTFPEGESMAQMSARSVAAVRRWCEQADTEAADGTADARAETAVSASEGTASAGTASAGTHGNDAGELKVNNPGPAQAPSSIPTVLIVSHGDIIKAIVADALGMHLDAFQRICIDPCSVSVIQYHQGRPIVECVNANGAVLRSWRNPTGPTVQAVPGGGAGR